MNLHGYKRSKKRMTQTIAREQARKNPKQTLIFKLDRAKSRCSAKIRDLQKARGAK